MSGESVALGVLALCGLVTVLQMGVQTAPLAVAANETVRGDAEDGFVPRLAGEPVALVAYRENPNEPEFGRVWSNMVLDGDRLYFGVDRGRERGRILGVHRNTGKVEWSFEAPDMRKVYCTPTVAGGKLYCGEGEHIDAECRLFCANLSDGSAAWNAPFATGSHTEGAPAVADGKVYIPAGDDGLYCADANTGAEKWLYPGGAEKGIHVDAAPALSEDKKTVFAGSGLYTYVAVALDANTGKEKWKTDLRLRAFGAPLASGSKVYYGVGTGNMGADVFEYPEEGGKKDTQPAGAVVCLDAATGKEAWRYDLPQSVHTGLSADAFSIYAGCRDGFVYALDRNSGKLRWKTLIVGGVPLLSCPAVATSGGFPVAVYAVSSVGLMVCLNPQTGKVVWSGQLPGFQNDGSATGGVMCTPVVVTTLTPTGSRRTVYVGAMTGPPFQRTVAVFKFEDVIGE